MGSVRDKIQAAVEVEGEAWKPAHDEAMACCDLGDFIKLGLRHFGIIRAEDEAWSRTVQDDLSKFDANTARYFRSRYEWWIQPCEAVVKATREFEDIGYIVEGADEFRKAWALVRGILSTPIDDVIETMERVAKGEYEAL